MPEVATATTIRPFRIEIADADLADLRRRLEKTRWPDELPGVGWSYGVPVDYVKKLAERWQSGYAWPKDESRLNAWPQFTTTIDGQNVHFLHIRSSEPNAFPLILTHGWPGSVMEYLDVIEPLSNPGASGAPRTDAFHLVIPSVPGFGFSGPTTEPGWNRYRTARAWAELMRRLGYSRYGAVGNDGGALISPEVGRIDPDRVAGVHVTQIFSLPSGDPAELTDLSDEDAGALKHLQWFYENMSAYQRLQATQPQNLAFALADSPVGQLAWSGQLFTEAVDADFILANVTIYWLTRTAASSMRFYYEDAHAEHPTEPTTVPIGLANFANDFKSFRRFAERDHKNIVHWNQYASGGHYAAHQVPDLFVTDLRDFFRRLR